MVYIHKTIKYLGKRIKVKTTSKSVIVKGYGSFSKEKWFWMNKVKAAEMYDRKRISKVAAKYGVKTPITKDSAVFDLAVYDIDIRTLRKRAKRPSYTDNRALVEILGNKHDRQIEGLRKRQLSEAEGVFYDDGLDATNMLNKYDNWRTRAKVIKQDLDFYKRKYYKV